MSVKFELAFLSITGFNNLPVPNRLFRPAIGKRQPQRSLALLLPGLRYTCDMPLLYYPTQLFLERGVDVLQLLTDYTGAKFQSLSRLEQAGWLAVDANAGLQSGLAQGDYAQSFLVGKSIGTLALAALAANQVPGAYIWLTPLLRQPLLVQAARDTQQPELLIAGTSDSTFDLEAMREIQKNTAAEWLLVKGADHSLEIPGNLPESIQKMGQIIEGIADFIDRHMPG